MSIVLRIPGKRVPASSVLAGVDRSGGVANTSARSAILNCIQVLDAFEVAAPGRSQSPATVESVEMAEDDILEMQFADGTSIYTSVGKYAEDMQWSAPESQTAGAIDWRPLPADSSTERGIIDWGVTRLNRLRVAADELLELASDPQRWPKEMPQWLRDAGLGVVGKAGGWLLIQALTWFIERQLTPGPGLYRWPIVKGRPAVDFQSLKPVELTKAPSGPLLVCIHGTASSSLGSFRQLFVQDIGKEPGVARPEWGQLERLFGENIFAFEHRTLSVSPIDNAIDLATWLPMGAEVRLLSHSRGGLVGDLLCLPAIPKDWRVGYRRPASWENHGVDGHDQAQLEKLDKLLREKKFKITYFARVASPARGTLLASENIERFLSSLTRLVGLIPGVGASLTFQVIKRVTLEVVRARGNARWIPGIEAMVPDSPLVRMLNSTAARVNSTRDSKLARGRLGIVAGDCDGGGLVRRAFTKMNDWIIHRGRENDWVVNTDSMFEGVARQESPSHYVFDRGPDVSHFSYFANSRTREAIVHWLTQTNTPTGDEYRPPQGFTEVSKGRELQSLPRAASRSRGASDHRPRVVVIPGIMGSHLEKNGSRIWFNFFEIIRGKLSELTLAKSRAGVSAGKVKPTDLLEHYYCDLCEFLAQSHDVVRFPYDWRLSLADLGAQLADRVKLLMSESPARPIRFIAHSMGGLVARAMIGQGESTEIWDKLCREYDARLVMLGTPNRGSHAIVGMLTGFDTLSRRLALLDLNHSLEKLLDLVASFPGVLELLPREDAWWKSETWRLLRKANRGQGALPTEESLAKAFASVRRLSESIPHLDRVLYVAGQAPATLANARVERDRLVFDATPAGDGRVTHEAGLLPGVAAWFVNAQHGDLPSHKAAFSAYDELLQRGTTRALARTASSLRGEAAARIDQPAAVLFPTETDLVDDILGRQPMAPTRDAARGVTIRIVHGDLCYAKHPVMVGHFAGDTLTGPEAVLDAQLCGMLSQRHRFGVYPGPLGTTYTALRGSDVKDKRLPGAIVIGLGGIGDLSPSVLANSIRDGVIDYVMSRAALLGMSPNGNEPRVGVGLSMLLVGSASASQLSVEDSVAAILRGVAAASREIERNQCPVYLEEMEIIELFADSVIEAARAVAQLAPAISREFEARLEFDGKVKQGQGRRQRLWSREGRSKWHRWAISPVHKPNTAQTLAELPPALRCALRDCLVNYTNLNESIYRDLFDLIIPECRGQDASTIELRFVAMTDRARAERTTQQFQPQLVEQMVAESIRDTQFRREQAVILGRMLIPSELSENILHNSRLVLGVDEATANYPWEMMILADKPLALQLPLIRQLQTAAAHRKLNSSTGRAAFVVGAPKTSDSFPDLPSARAEGERVAAMLAEHGYHVESFRNAPTAKEVLEGLYARPYRVMHIAGHGYFETGSTHAKPARCGVVLDQGLYLTAAELSQVRQLPHLVFLNCCHLGVVNDATRAGSVPYNKLAASLSLELIKMGVHAVVAAGWAVDDAAAAVFADQFYGRLLAGETFGDAIDGARRVTHERFPASNTWGAYQAYGDPDFLLRANLGEAAASDKPQAKTYYLPEEIIADIDNLSSAAKKAEASADDVEKSRLRERLGKIELSWPIAWHDNPQVKAALGRAYEELADWQKAIKFYESALAAEPFDDNFDIEGSVRFKLVEQLANCEARSGNVDLIKKSILRLEDLLKVAESSERFALLGSAYKRLAVYLSKKSPNTGKSTSVKGLRELKKAAQWYYQAWQRRPHKTYYAQNYLTYNMLASNKVVIQKVTMPQPGGKLEKVSVDECVSRLISREHKSNNDEPNVWDALNLVDLEVLQLLYQPKAPTIQHVAEIVKRYQDAFVRFHASARERDSVLTNLEIQLRFLRNTAKEPFVKKIVAQLKSKSAAEK